MTATNGYSAKVTINGTEYSYPDGPTMPGYSVYFRPDEVVFHWGKSLDKTVSPVHLGPYTATVYKDGVVVKTYNVPAHWWPSRWLHEINPDTIIRTPKDLISNFLALPYGDTGVTPQPISSPVFEGPMGTAGLVTYEPTTGERSEIGLTNDWAAHYLRTGDATSMIEVGKAAFSMPMFWTDERTGKPFNLVTDPYVNTYSTTAQGGPWLGPFPPASNPPCPWSLDSAHGMEDEGVIYLATGMDRHLEALQYRAVAMFMGDNAPSRRAGYAVAAPDQVRAVAWKLRQLAYALKATLLREAQGPLPDYMLPSSVFMTMMDNQVTWMTQQFMNNPAFQSLHYYLDGSTPLWQQDYLNAALGLLTMWWPEKWGAFYLWSLCNVIQRTNGKSGWPPAFPTWYKGNLLSNVATNTFFATWGDAWQDWCKHQLDGTDISGNPGQITQAQYDALQKDPYNGGWYISANDYCVDVRGALALAVYLDRNKILDVSTTYPELEQCFAVQDAMTKNGKLMLERWSFAVDPQPVTTVVINPVNPASPIPPPAPDAADASLFDAPAVLNYQTSHDSVLIDLTGKVPAGNGKLVFNLKGNGQTRVNVIWPGTGADWMRNALTDPKTAADTPMGGKVWVDNHATGDKFVLYNCGTSLIFNGGQIGTPQADPPPVTTPPKEPPPMSDPLSALSASVHAVTASFNNLKTRIAAMAAAATSSGTMVDPAELQSLVDELNADQAGMDAIAPSA